MKRQEAYNGVLVVWNFGEVINMLTTNAKVFHNQDDELGEHLDHRNLYFQLKLVWKIEKTPLFSELQQLLVGGLQQSRFRTRDVSMQSL